MTRLSYFMRTEIKIQRKLEVFRLDTHLPTYLLTKNNKAIDKNASRTQ